MRMIASDTFFNRYFFIGLMSMMAMACSTDKNQTISPTIQDLTESVYASGVVKAGGQYEVFSPYSGILTANLVKAGDSVETGTPLFVVDNTISSISSDNARISAELLRDKTGPQSNVLLELEKRLSLAKEKMNNDSLLLARQQNLWSQQVGSKIELEKRELAFKASKTEYESLLLQFRQTKLELEKSYRQALNSVLISEKQKSDFTIKSNLKGTIYSTMREPGEWVSIQTPLGVIGETGTYEIELQVDEFDIVRVKTGQRIFISMDSYKGSVFEAVVNRIEPYMNPRTRTFTIFASFSKAPDVVYPNLSVEANIVISVKEKALTIPASCLIGNNKVISENGDTLSVKTGARNLDWVEITEGISSTDKIVKP